MQAAKVDLKFQVLVVPVQSLPKAELVVLEVSRLRPKGSDECKMETQELLDMTAYLQGAAPSGPGVPPMRWPANLGMDFYLTRAPNTILSCKVKDPFVCVIVCVTCFMHSRESGVLVMCCSSRSCLQPCCPTKSVLASSSPVVKCDEFASKRLMRWFVAGGGNHSEG